MTVPSGLLPLCFAGIFHTKEMFAPHFGEQSTVATWMPVTGFHYGNDAKRGPRAPKSIKLCSIALHTFCDKNSLILEFQKPLPTG